MLVIVRGCSLDSGFESGFGFPFVAARFSGWKSVTIAKARGVSGKGVWVLWWWSCWLLLVLVVGLAVEEEVEEEANSYVCELRRAITEPVGVRP